MPAYRDSNNNRRERPQDKSSRVIRPSINPNNENLLYSNGHARNTPLNHFDSHNRVNYNPINSSRTIRGRSVEDTSQNKIDIRRRDQRPLKSSSSMRAGRPSKAYQGTRTSFITYMWENYRKFSIIICLIAVFLVVGLLDAAINGNKIYAGVHIGDIDVSGLTVEDAKVKISEKYDKSIQTSTAYIFPNIDNEQASDISADSYVVASNNEKMSFHDAQSKELLWMENANNTGAALALDAMTQEALSIGKNFRFWERIAVGLTGYDIPIAIDFNSGAIDTLLDSVNTKIGTPMVNYNIKINEGVANVIEGHNGNLVSVDFIKSQLTYAFLRGENQSTSIVAKPEEVFVQIDNNSAAETADFVTSTIATGASFYFNDDNIALDKAELGNWVDTEVAEREIGGHYLNPIIDIGTASLQLTPKIGFTPDTTSTPVIFKKNEKGQIDVTLENDVMLPNIDAALGTLDKGLFNSFRERAYKNEKFPKSVSSSSSIKSSANVFGIPIEMTMLAGPFNFNEAMALGVISEISSYSTSFYYTDDTKNRIHNIGLAAERINNSIINANGGKWSWIEIAGACAEEDGFLPAGAIVADEYVQETGGGICQVATTIFNSVYEAGYKVLERHNHTLRMRSYPDGRDAAVAYPTLDFIWQNETPSDVLLKATVDDTSVTVSLYGVNPNYIVTTEVGDWEEGEDFDIVVKKEASYLALDESEITIEGTNGSAILVKRYVRDKNNNIIYADSFLSSYYPKTEVIMIHPDSELDEKQLIQDEKDRLKEEAEKKKEKEQNSA